MTSSTSGYFAASAWAALVMAPIQPWSAAGAEKPIFIFSPVVAALAPESALAAADTAADAAAVAAAAAELVSLDVLLPVHPAMSALAATTTPTVVTSLMLRALIGFLFLMCSRPPGRTQESSHCGK